MSWEDRIQQAAIESPSGVRLLFDYEDVSRSFDKKSSAFEFADFDGTYIQQSGNSGRRFPLRLWFSGPDYDLSANLLEVMLQEAGIFTLEHPIYGNVKCVPFGTVARRDDLATAANQAPVDVEFWETILDVYPLVNADLSGQLTAAIEAFNTAQAEQFDALIDVDTSIERISLANQITSFVSDVQTNLKPIYSAFEDVSAQYTAIESSITRGLDVLVSDPLTLAFQSIQLIQAPARAFTALQDRLSGYGSLFGDLTSQALSVLGYDSREKNSFLSRELFAASALSSYALITLNADISTQEEALTTAQDVLTKLDTFAAWRDADYTTASLVDDGGSFQALQSLCAATAAKLIQESFGLLKKVSFVTSQAHTPIDLCSSLYGADFEAQFDFFLSTNNFIGTELLEIPKGRTIVHYV